MRTAMVVLIACGSPSRPAPASQPLPAEDGCVRITTLEHVTAMCSSGARGRCVADVPIAIANCDPGPVTVTKIDQSSKGELPHEIAPGTTWTFRAKVFDFMHGEPTVTMPILVEITTTKLTRMETVEVMLVDDHGIAAQAACKACKGDWAQHTRGGGDDCICRTHDRGKRCEGPKDCEGWCERDHFVPVSNGLGYEIGKCSEWVEEWSCTSPIRDQHELGPDAVARECRD